MYASWRQPVEYVYKHSPTDSREQKNFSDCLTITHVVYLETPVYLLLIPTTGAAEADWQWG